MEAIGWRDDTLFLLDQRLLPNVEKIVPCNTVDEVCDMIKTLGVRGAPAIGITSAYGMVLAAQNWQGSGDFCDYMEEAETKLAKTRPTAVNLFWALKEIHSVWAHGYSDDICQKLLTKAHQIKENDYKRCLKIGENGGALLKEGSRILTHCNAGTYVTGGHGTALGVVRTAFAQGKVAMVYADETRPLLQGARITTYELLQDGIPVTLISDNMAASLMARGMIDVVITGADRIAANGDTANKIGTYGVAILANYHHIPFYIAAPLSTVDYSLKCGEDIPIEERNGDEVRKFAGVYTCPVDVQVVNPAFDVTPHTLIKGIITEKGVISGDFEAGLRKWREI